MKQVEPAMSRIFFDKHGAKSHLNCLLLYKSYKNIVKRESQIVGRHHMVTGKYFSAVFEDF